MLFQIIMLKKLIVFLIISVTQFCLSLSLAWNTNRPFKYKGFIYTDSSVAVISPNLQVILKSGEEICNFQLTKSDYNRETLDYNPFRAVVKSAHLGLGEIELLANINLSNFTNADINLIITGQACHNPDSWTEPAEISIKVIDPPEPLWTKSSYVATITNDAIIGSPVIKVTAYLPPLADPDNKICQYHIENSSNSPFTIDGSGTISTRQNLLNSDVTLVILDVTAEDCSLPTHRQSTVKVFITITPICKIGWTGFYKIFQYLSGSGVIPIGKKLEFRFCSKNPKNNLNQIIENCKLKKKFRVTVSIEFKDLFLFSQESTTNDNDICYLDYKSLKLQRKICDINDNKAVDLLNALAKQKTGVIKFPLETNMFPGLSVVKQDKFSLLFWMLRKTPEENFDEFIVCHLHESGDILFSVSISFCNLRIFLNSSSNVQENSQLFFWEYNLSTICDNKWHHYLLHIQRSRDRNSHEVNILIDGESVEHKIQTPATEPRDFVKSPINEKYNFFIGQSTRTSKRYFKGYIAGLIYLPDIIVKSSSVRCLMKCMERLHFNGMNEMNPGMSVSLNSEMQTIIINGHNVEEVAKLVEDVGYANPKWNPIPGLRIIAIKTDMSCDKHVINIPNVNITVNVSRQNDVVTYGKLINSIIISSKTTEIIIDDVSQIRSTTGVGLSVFANATISIYAIPLSTAETLSEETLTISRCIVSVHPELVKTKEYFDWPQQALDTLNSENHLIKVTNNSKKIIFFGDFNYQIYQFIIQHLSYFSSSIPNFNRRFQLQCSSDVGMAIIDSNILVVKIKASSLNKTKLKHSRNARKQNNLKTPLQVESKYLVNESQKSNNPFMHMGAHSNVAKLLEGNNEVKSEKFPKPTKVYSYFLVVGILILVCSFTFMIRKFQKAQAGHYYYLPFKVIDCICLPLQTIREKIRPSSLVRVELSRDYLNRASVKRREISLELQWDDSELKSNRKYHIIENPIYEKSDLEFDDNYLNNDIPPICEKEDLTTDDETDEEIDYNLNIKDSQHEKSIMKKRLIDL